MNSLHTSITCEPRELDAVPLSEMAFLRTRTPVAPAFAEAPRIDRPSAVLLAAARAAALTKERDEEKTEWRGTNK